MGVQIFTIVVLVVVFAVATWRSVHMGALALAAALLVGTAVLREDLDTVLGEFPVDILLLLLGLSLLFGIARSNGALEWVVARAVRVVGNRKAALPFLFFLLSAGISSLGSPLASITLKPFAIEFAGRYRMSPMVLLLSAATGASTGAFAPTSLFGLLTVRIAERNGIEVNPMLLFGCAAGINLILFTVAWRVYRRTLVDELAEFRAGQDDVEPVGGTDTAGRLAVKAPGRTRLTAFQGVTIVAVIALVLSVVAFAFAGVTLDVGALALGLGVALVLAFPEQTSGAVKQSDWSTILLVGGIVTYVEMMDRVGALDTVALLGARIPVPLLAAFVLCLGAAAISAFGSTTGLLPIILPLSIPLATSGSVSAVGVICALALSASLVDVSPFSTSGAAAVSSAPEPLRPAVRAHLLRWGMTMIVAGPVLTCAILVAPWG